MCLFASSGLSRCGRPRKKSCRWEQSAAHAREGSSEFEDEGGGATAASEDVNDGARAFGCHPTDYHAVEEQLQTGRGNGGSGGGDVKGGGGGGSGDGNGKSGKKRKNPSLDKLMLQVLSLACMYLCAYVSMGVTVSMYTCTYTGTYEHFFSTKPFNFTSCACICV